MTFEQELQSLINKYSRENASNTPDFILAEYLLDCLQTYERTTQKVAEWRSPKTFDRRFLGD